METRQAGVTGVPVVAPIGAFEHASTDCSIDVGWCQRVDRQSINIGAWLPRQASCRYEANVDKASIDRLPSGASVNALENTANLCACIDRGGCLWINS